MHIMENLNDDVNVKKLDIEVNMEGVQRLGIQSVPTVVFFEEDGRELGRLVGARTEQKVRDYIAELEK